MLRFVGCGLSTLFSYLVASKNQTDFFLLQGKGGLLSSTTANCQLQVKETKGD